MALNIASPGDDARRGGSARGDVSCDGEACSRGGGAVSGALGASDICALKVLAATVSAIEPPLLVLARF